MTPSVKVHFTSDHQGTKPWLHDLVVYCGQGFGILTTEIALPFGDSLTQNNVEFWARENVPTFLARHGEILRFHVLVSRNAPEGTCHRILLIAGSPCQDEEPLCDLRFPREFALLAQAESEASMRGGNFLWTINYSDTWHWLLYRDGLLAFWGNEILPSENQESWIQERLESVKAFALSDAQFERIESIDVRQGVLPEDPETAIASLCTWGWVRSLSLLVGANRTRLETIRDQRRTLRNTVFVLVLILVAAFALNWKKTAAERALQDLQSQAGPLVQLQKEESQLLDSLQVRVLALQGKGRSLQGALDLKNALHFIFQALPENAKLENLNVENTGIDGFRYLLQVRVSNWDDADLLMKNYRSQSAWRSVKLDSRRPSGQNGIQVRLEVTR